MFKLDLEKAEEKEIKLPTSVGSLKKQDKNIQKNIYFCFTDYPEAFDCVLLLLLHRFSHVQLCATPQQTMENA